KSLARALRKLALSATALIGLALSPAFGEDINALVWCDHSDPNFLKPFEDATGIKVNVKEFEGTAAGLAILDQSHRGEWDVMLIDSIDSRRGVDKGLFEPLPEDKLPFGDLYKQVTLDQFTKIDGKRYGITEKFGYNTIGFNNSKVDPNDMQSLQSLMS